MPELPEVEYIARQLREEVVGRRITQACVLWERTIQGMEPRAFEAEVAGRTIISVGRRAKYLLVTLGVAEASATADDAGQPVADAATADTTDTAAACVLILHRRMSGNVILAQPDELTAGVVAFDPYTRADFTLDDRRHIVFSDPRKFGRIALIAPDALGLYFAAIGPEPLDAAFTPAALAQRLAGHRGPIKATLLDQSVVAGLGNIYADEALYRARIHPLRPANTLTPTETAALHAGIQGALEDGVAHGGVTFDRHRDIYNEAGTNLNHVEAYQRTGQPCLRCGTPIQRIVVAQRSAHFCPACQRLP